MLKTKIFFLNNFFGCVQKGKRDMKHSDDISNTFLALNFWNLYTKFKSSNKSSNINMYTIWDVILNQNKYNDQINDLLKNHTFSSFIFQMLHDNKEIYK